MGRKMLFHCIRRVLDLLSRRPTGGEYRQWESDDRSENGSAERPEEQPPRPELKRDEHRTGQYEGDTRATTVASYSLYEQLIELEVWLSL